MDNKFEVGDVVVCILTTSLMNLTHGSLYTIRSLHEDASGVPMVHLEGLPQDSFFAYRFKLAEESTDDPVSDEVSHLHSVISVMLDSEISFLEDLIETLEPSEFDPHGTPQEMFDSLLQISNDVEVLQEMVHRLQDLYRRKEQHLLNMENS